MRGTINKVDQQMCFFSKIKGNNLKLVIKNIYYLQDNANMNTEY